MLIKGMTTASQRTTVTEESAEPELKQDILELGSTSAAETAEPPRQRKNLRQRTQTRKAFQAEDAGEELRRRLEKVKPKAIPPGHTKSQESGSPVRPIAGQPIPEGLPDQSRVLGKGGKGGLAPKDPPGPFVGPNGPLLAKGEAPQAGGVFGPASKENAERALANEPDPDPDHPYVQEKGVTSRRLGQLGLDQPGDDRIFVKDLDERHGAAVTRTIAGKTGLARGAEITTDAPRGDAYARGRDEYFKRTAHPFGKADPTVDDFVRADVHSFPKDLAFRGHTISQARQEVEARNDGKKTFMNMSYGRSPDEAADLIAKRMLVAKPGTKLREETIAALGREPNIMEIDGRRVATVEDLETLKRKVIFPKMQAEMATDEHQQEMSRARAYVESEVAQARDAGILVFQAAGNSHASAGAAGDAQMSASLTSGVKGIFRVGATVPHGPGTADDQVAPFSSGGKVTASTSGVGVPVGLNEDGTALDLSGTSLASPIMTETAFAVSSANPDLSIDEIESILTDPRVARDIQGTERDGAGVVDQFAAVLLAKDRTLTADQIEKIRTTLDASPEQKFGLGASGALLPQE